MRKGVRPVALLLAALASTVHAQTAPPTGWRIFGSNEILVEDFIASGDVSRSPFRLEGTFWTNRLNVNLGWTDERQRDLAIRAEILGADNDYLPEDGFVVGTFSLRFENGAAAVPYRVEVGDVLADVSRRVLQRQIRGTTIEFQPQFGAGTHSIMLLTGSGVPDWRDTFTDGNALFFTAASWLWQNASERTSIVANISSETARAGAEGAFPQASVDRDHRLASLSAKTSIGRTQLEGEVSLFDGEENATSFFAAAGRSEGVFTWLLRYEENDEHYAPLGAMGIMAGRSIGEARAGWRPSVRSWLQGWLQQIEHGVVSTDVAALTWDAQPMPNRPALRIAARADLNRIESDDGLQDVLFRNLGLEVRDDFAQRYDVTYRASLRETEDDVRPEFDRSALEHELVGGGRFRAGGWSGRIGAGVGYRRFGESASFDSWSPVLEASLQSASHLVRLYYGLMRQRYDSSTIEDLGYQNRRLLYMFTRSNHQISLEYGQELREPERALETDSQRLALRYRYTFDMSFRAP